MLFIGRCSLYLPQSVRRCSARLRLHTPPSARPEKQLSPSALLHGTGGSSLYLLRSVQAQAAEHSE